MRNLDLICQRVQMARLLLDFYQRAFREKKFRQATKILRARMLLLRALKEKRGWE